MCHLPFSKVYPKASLPGISAQLPTNGGTQPLYTHTHRYNEVFPEPCRIGFTNCKMIIEL